ncbi:hypothetical protein CJD50_14120 [Hafnia paralvei]|uniref:Uncharacterized protein n=1 Tax=Hafnia paralvei TaxID=546367 RepID=A0A2A2MCT8_9GAMM|nr:hypothetical protein [Hafnia paralvei]PAV96146.1 hypothetical protein CJD50_14120 [Hafnia paralvei]
MTFDVGVMHPNSPHLFADLAELLTVINYTGRNSLHKNDLDSVRKLGATSIEEIDDEENINEEIDADAEKNDRFEEQLEDVWTQLEYRESSLGNRYPFIISGDEIIFKENLNEQQRIYVFLLCCSRLRSFKSIRGAAQRWAKSFARVCKIAMLSLLPRHGVVRIFDVNSDDRRDYYGTNLRNALSILGKDLGVCSLNTKEIAKAPTSGDAGFDLIATVEFPDGQTSNYGILGQCGAQEKGWPSKTLEANVLNLTTYFQIAFQHPSTMFTPVFYREANGEWVNTRATAGVLLLDRLRIMYLLEKANQWEAISTSNWFREFEEELNAVTPEP